MSKNTGEVSKLKCKICGCETSNNILCAECREEIDFLSAEILSIKKKINLDFNEHHYMG